MSVDVKKELLTIAENSAIETLEKVLAPLAEQFIKDSSNK